jgi:glyoxylase-like metal-dependent hydrolase (beta-lactamase superfamily II)
LRVLIDAGAGPELAAEWEEPVGQTSAALEELGIAEGIRAFPTPGHTPGHMSVSLSSEGQAGLVAGDAILTEWSYEHPHWYASPEVDSELTVTSRKARSSLGPSRRARSSPRITCD